MGLDVPVSIDILGVVDFVTGDFNLLETPLRQINVTSTKIAAQTGMLESESSGQSSELAAIVR